MQKLSSRKQLSIAKLYLGGFSYDEIAARAGVSKGTVANVVADLRAGRILDAQEPAEQLELLRELAIDLRRLKLSPGQAVVGIAAVGHLQELGIEPGDIEPWAAMCRHLAADETEVQTFMRAALYMEQLRERTGLTVEALGAKMHLLEEEVARLEPLAQELRGCQQHLKDLQKQRQAITDEISQLEKRREPLRKIVTQMERREGQLSHRIQELEESAQAADERLAAARKELKVLAGLGLAPDDIPGFVQRLAAVSQRHGIKTGSLRDRLLHELEELETGLGLESLVEARRHDLDGIEKSIMKGQREREALESSLKQLRQQQESLHAAIAEEQAQVRKEIRAIAAIAKDAEAKLREDMANSVAQALLEVQKLRGEAIELGQELGRYDAIVEANRWLQTLVALVKGDGSVSAEDVRVIGLLVLRSLRGWIQQNQPQIPLSFGLTTWLGSAIEELERWKV